MPDITRLVSTNSLLPGPDPLSVSGKLRNRLDYILDWIESDFLMGIHYAFVPSIEPVFWPSLKLGVFTSYVHFLGLLSIKPVIRPYLKSVFLDMYKYLYFNNIYESSNFANLSNQFYFTSLNSFILHL